jgi:hypothetical protein
VTTKKKKKIQTVPHNRLPDIKEEVEAPIVSRVAFRAIRLIQSDSLVEVPPEKIPAQTNISVTTGFGRNIADEKSLVGVVSFAMASHNEGDERPLIVIRCKMQLLYELLSGTVPTSEEVHAQEYAITAMVSYQAWPYIREYVHGMTLKMGLPPLILQPLVINPVQGSPGTFRVAPSFEPLGPAD